VERGIVDMPQRAVLTRKGPVRIHEMQPSTEYMRARGSATRLGPMDGDGSQPRQPAYEIRNGIEPAGPDGIRRHVGIVDQHVISMATQRQARCGCPIAAEAASPARFLGIDHFFLSTGTNTLYLPTKCTWRTQAIMARAAPE